MNEDNSNNKDKIPLTHKIVFGASILFALGTIGYEYDMNREDKKFHKEPSLIALDSTYISRRDSLAKVQSIQRDSLEKEYQLRLHNVFENYKKEHGLNPQWSIHKSLYRTIEDKLGKK